MGPFELVEDAIEECMLDSFFIWGLRRKIYSKVLKWFMVLNSDKNFKYALAKFFSKNYIYIILKMGHPPNEYLKKETHLLPISCQFLFWPSKAFILASEFNLLKAILFCLYYTLFKYNTEPVKLTIDLIFSDAAFDHKLLFEENDTENFNYHLVPLENFLQFLSNKDTAYYIVKNADITSLYIDIIKFVQGMDVNTKADYFQENVEEYRYFNAHNEVCMFPFWTIVHHFKQDTESFLDNNFFDAIFENLSNWVAYYPQELFRFSFHLPLHRISAILLASEMRKGILCNKNFKFCADFLVRAVQHPMRILAISSEVLIGTWLSNGDQLIIQSKLYRSANFSAGTIDPDYYLTQLAAAQLNPNYFTQLIFEIFLVIGLLRDDVLSFQYPHQRHFLLGNVLFFMAIIVSARVLAGKHEKNLLRSEVITSLATREKSFHVVIRSIPDRGPNVQPYWTKDLKTVLDSVAQLKPTMINDYSEPLDRIFTLNTKVFLEEYDPVMARMRSVSSRDYDESVRNYIQRVRNEKLSKDDPWPPFRSPIEPHHPFLNGFTNFLHCISLHAYIFIALHYCYKGFWPESTLQITIHLLNMSFKFPYYEPDKENNTRSETSCLYRNCMIPFDYEFNILSDYGLYDFLRQIDPPPYRTPYETHTGYFEKHHFQLFPIYGLEFATKPKRKLFSHIDRLYAMGPMQDIVHDTILSLLLKLFSNLTKKIYKPPYMRNEETVKYGSPSSTGVRIGGAEYFIGEVLDQLVEGCEEVLQEVERYVSIEMQNASGDDARAERRKKKLKTKKELLKQKMEAKRKNLLQEIEADAPSEEPLEEKPKCVICAQAFVSDPDNPVCQLSYVTRTNLLGHRVSQRHLELLYRAENTFSYNFEKVQSTCTSLTFFKENPPWYDNMWIQTCGHLVHTLCYYNKIFQTMKLYDENGMPLKFEKKKWFFERELSCNLCRQLCNVVIPLAGPITLATSFPHGQKLGRRIVPKYHIIESIFQEAKQASLSETTEAIHVNILNTTNIYSNHYSLFVSIFRNNLELHLMNKRELAEQKKEKNDAMKVYKPTKHINLNALYSLFRDLARNRTMREASNMLHVLKPLHTASNLQENISYVDIKQVLTTTILFISEPSEEKVKNVICFFHNLFVMQLLAWLVVSADKNEAREVLKNKVFSNTQLSFIIGFMLKKVANPDNIGILPKWNDEEESFLETFKARLKEFLKFCALLYVSVFMSDDELLRDIGSMSMKSLYDLLLFNHNFERDHVSCVRFFGWEEETMVLYLKKFCAHTFQLAITNPNFKMMEKLMLADWKPPKMFLLPMRFEDFRHFYDDHKRTKVHEIKQCLLPKVCLMCGRVTSQEMRHMASCGRGTGWFMKVEENCTLAYWSCKRISWPSPYVNAHGETKIYLDGSIKLFLDEERYQQMQDMWLFNSFDSIVKHWPEAIS